MRNAYHLCVRYFVLSLIVLSMFAATVPAQQECNSLGAPTVQTGAIAGTDTAQTTRLFRDGRGTTCSFNRTATTSAGAYNSDQYSFTNTTGGTACVFLDLDSTGCGVATNQIGMAVYSPSYNPAAITTNLIGDPGLSTGSSFAASMAVSIPAGATYVVVVHNINAGTTCASYTLKHYITNGCRQPGYDAANDGSADLALFRPSGGLSNFLSTSANGGSVITTQFGSTGDIPVPGDYNGDEASDVGVFRPSSGIWYTSTNAANNYGAKLWGVSGDVPVQGDYDRDGITDVAVYRPSTNVWYVLRSSDATFMQIPIGLPGDVAVPADYDGDGRMDAAVWRPSSGYWGILSSSGNYNALQSQLIYGAPTDTPVPADYDGDGKADQAVYRPSEGTWYVFRSSLTTGQSIAIPFGATGDNPQPADYDGDKKADQAVFRPSTNTWYILKSTGGVIGTSFGASGDIPVSK